MFLSLWPNYWDDWLLEHKISFSGPEKIIYIHPDITDISVKIDLYSAWKEWFLLRDNSKYESAMRVVGGDPISDTRSLGSTYFLTNGWRLKPVQGEYRISIEGNLYTDEGDNQMINADQPSSVNVQFIVSNLVESTISKLTQVEISAFSEALWGADYLSHTLSGTYGKLIYDLKTDVESISIKLPAGNLAESGEYTSVLNNIELYVLRSLGLSQENYYLDNTIYTDYQGMKLLTSGRIRIYSNSSSVGTDSNVLSTYQIISSWTGNSLTSYKVVKL